MAGKVEAGTVQAGDTLAFRPGELVGQASPITSTSNPSNPLLSHTTLFSLPHSLSLTRALSLCIAPETDRPASGQRGDGTRAVRPGRRIAWPDETHNLNFDFF